jgi:peroxin-1
MPRHVKIHFVPLRSSLVNLPISIYGPLLQRNAVSVCSLLPCHSIMFPHPVETPGPRSPADPARKKYRGVRRMDRNGLGLISCSFQLSLFCRKGNRDPGNRPPIRPGARFQPRRCCTYRNKRPNFGIFIIFFKVEIGLLHDLGYAKSVGTEPLTADDWEILVGLHLTIPNPVDRRPVSGIARFPRRVELDLSGQGCQHWSRDRRLGTGTH